MKSVRVQPLPETNDVLVDVMCDCWSNGLTNEATGEKSFKHRVAMGQPAEEPQIILRCECGARYGVRAQTNHVHVYDIKETN